MRIIIMTTAAALLAISSASADDGAKVRSSTEASASLRSSQAPAAPAPSAETSTSVAIDEEASVVGGAEVLAPRLAPRDGAGMSPLPSPTTTARGAMTGAVGVGAEPPASSNRQPTTSGF